MPKVICAKCSKGPDKVWTERGERHIGVWAICKHGKIGTAFKIEDTDKVRQITALIVHDKDYPYIFWFPDYKIMQNRDLRETIATKIFDNETGITFA